MTDTLTHHELTTEWVDDNRGRAIMLTQPAEIITRAMAAGAGEWCTKVRATRRARRAQAAQARREASRANAASNGRRPHPAQWGLFEGGAA